MSNEIRRIKFLHPIVKRFQKRLSYILIAMVIIVGGGVALLSWQISALSRSNVELRLHESRLRTRIALQPAAISMHPASMLPNLPQFDAFQSVVADTQSLFEEMRLSLRDATHTPQLTDADSRIRKVEMTVHAKGEYQAIKKAIAALLAKHEELALTSLALAREQSTDGLPQVEARFTFFYSKQK